MNRWYGAQVAGLNFNTNVLDLYAIPNPKGAAPQILTIPNLPPIQLDNRAVSGDRNAFWADRRPDSNLILIRGSVRHTLRDPIHVTIHDPPMFFGRLMERRLRDAGVPIGMVMRVLPEQIVPAGNPLAIVSTDLSAILTRCNRDSQNLYAESLLKWLGHRVTGRPGSWTNGPAAVRMFLSHALGPEAAGVVVDDGSGYSRNNRISPLAMSRLLQYIHDQTDLAPRFISSMAKPGEGTLKERFSDPALFDPDSGNRIPRALIGQVYAKSGYLNGVYALSGYLVNEQTTVAFSMMLNQYTGGGSHAKSLMEDVISALDHAVNTSAPATAATTSAP